MKYQGLHSNRAGLAHAGDAPCGRGRAARRTETSSVSGVRRPCRRRRRRPPGKAIGRPSHGSCSFASDQSAIASTRSAVGSWKNGFAPWRAAASAWCCQRTIAPTSTSGCSFARIAQASTGRARRCRRPGPCRPAAVGCAAPSAGRPRTGRRAPRSRRPRRPGTAIAIDVCAGTSSANPPLAVEELPVWMPGARCPSVK